MEVDSSLRSEAVYSGRAAGCAARAAASLPPRTAQIEVQISDADSGQIVAIGTHVKVGLCMAFVTPMHCASAAAMRF